MRVMGWVRVRAAKGILNSELSTSCKLAPAGETFVCWFILQHLRGYKPFITKIAFEKEFSGTLNIENEKPNIENEKPNRLQRETLNERILKKPQL